MPCYVPFRNGRIAYYKWGSGTPLVIIHGYWLNAAVWGSFAELLAKVHLVISIDLPGHGKSDAFPPVHHMDTMAEAVKAVLDAEGFATTAMLGHSMGGYAGLAFMEMYGENLSHFILLNSYPFADPAEKIPLRDKVVKIIKAGKKDLLVKQVMLELFGPGFDPETNPMHNQVYEETLSQSADSLIATTLAMKLRPNREAIVRNFTKPFTWILGKTDEQNHTETMIERAQQQKLPKPLVLDTGHMSFLEKPELVAEAVLNFLNS